MTSQNPILTQPRLVATCDQGSGPRAPKSRSDVGTQTFGNVVHLRRRQTLDFKAVFPDLLAQWIQANFDRPEDLIAVAGMPIRTSTAWNWWNGDNSASGWAVMLLAQYDPSILTWFAVEIDRRAA